MESRSGILSPKGFTLIEVLVVMTIMALLMTAVPRMVAVLPGAQLRAAAADMANRLKGLHDEALRRGATTALTFDPGERSYRIAADPAPHRLPEVVDRVDVATGVPLRTGQPPGIRFFADGTATAGTILLRHGQRSASITVDWLTGRVRCDE